MFPVSSAIMRIRLYTPATEKTMPKADPEYSPTAVKRFLSYINRHKYIYLMLLPGAAYYIIFHYLPMYGLTLAFKDFNLRKGIFFSEWAGLTHFRYIFGLDKFTQVFRNTVLISLYRLIWGFPFPIIVALLINEVQRLRFKKFVQTSIYLPFFISWVILGGMMYRFLSIDQGLINQVRALFQLKPIGYLSDEKYFRSTLVVSMIWRQYGWGTIIYLAALTTVDQNIYEAAIIDGCSRFQRIWHITLPAIRSTIVIVLILRIGSIMQAGFEQIFVLYHPGVYRSADIIDTYVYRVGIQDGRFSIATAVGMFKSVINFILLVSVNGIARKWNQQGVY